MGGGKADRNTKHKKEKESKHNKERSSRPRTPQPKDENYHKVHHENSPNTELQQRRRSECPPNILKQENMKQNKSEKTAEKKVNNVTFLDTQYGKQTKSNCSDDWYLDVRAKDSKDSRLKRRKSETPLYIPQSKEIAGCTLDKHQ